MRILNIFIYIVLLSNIYCNAVWSSTDDKSVENKLTKGTSAYFSGNLKEALNILLPISIKGNAESQYYLGLIYSSSRWEKRDDNLAVSYLLSAADQNHSQAMWQMGRMYEEGVGVEQDLLMATDWYRKSKDKSVVYDIKLVTVKNKDTQPSWNKEIAKFEKRANSGDVESQYRLANMYDTGILIGGDLEKAFHWYKKAGENGHSYSMFMTGYFLCRGLVGEVNFVEANKWIKLSDRTAHCK